MCKLVNDKLAIACRSDYIFIYLTKNLFNDNINFSFKDCVIIVIILGEILKV